MKLQKHQGAAFAIAGIVVLVETVIIYDLWFAGGWLSSPVLSGFKTAAFVLIFIGSLIAEMQELRMSTRWLLFICIMILGAYQGVVNATVNYHSANVPSQAISFFVRLGFVAEDVPFWYAITDAFVRTTTGVIMWLVTGLVWRGVAYGKTDDEEKPIEVVEAKPRSEYSHWPNRNVEMRKAEIVRYVKDHDPDHDGVDVEDVWAAVWNGRLGAKSTKYKDITELVEADILEELPGNGNGRRVQLKLKDMSAF